MTDFLKNSDIYKYQIPDNVIRDQYTVYLQDIPDGYSCTLSIIKIDNRQKEELYRLDLKNELGALIATGGFTFYDDLYLNPEKKIVSIGMPVSIESTYGSYISLGGDFYVDEDYRRKGYAKKLLEYCLRQIEDLNLNYDSVLLSTGNSNNTMIRIAEELGFFIQRKNENFTNLIYRNKNLKKYPDN